jgi:hypothetical protein
VVAAAEAGWWWCVCVWGGGVDVASGGGLLLQGAASSEDAGRPVVAAVDGDNGIFPFFSFVGPTSRQHGAHGGPCVVFYFYEIVCRLCDMAHDC